LELFADPDHYSNTITAVTLGQGASAARLVEELRSRHDVHVGGGKVPGLEMIRIGHMGYVAEEDLDQLFSALADVARS
jgi:aspartate aminotransferase-like enzyme